MNFILIRAKRVWPIFWQRSSSSKLSFYVAIYVELTTELTTTYNVSEGSNLISFYGVPTDNSVSNVLSPANDFAAGIIGEGVAASQIAPGFWVGSLLNIELTSGYWLLVEGEYNAEYEFQITAPPPDVNAIYNIQDGANLISYIGINLTI